MWCIDQNYSQKETRYDAENNLDDHVDLICRVDNKFNYSLYRT